MNVATYEHNTQWFVVVGQGASWCETQVAESFMHAFDRSLLSVIGQEFVNGHDREALQKLWDLRPKLKSTIDHPVEESLDW